MMVKPMKALELHYAMIQFLKNTYSLTSPHEVVLEVQWNNKGIFW